MTSYSVWRWLLRTLLAVGLAVLLALVLVVILIAIPITRRFLIVVLADWLLGGRLESLAVDLDIQQNLRWIFVLVVVLPVGFGLARMAIARNFNSAARGLAVAVGTLLIVGLVVWWHTRHFNFDSQGRPVLYLSFRRNGACKSYSPGLDRVTGRPKYEATVDRVAWLSELASQPVRVRTPLWRPTGSMPTPANRISGTSRPAQTSGSFSTGRTSTNNCVWKSCPLPRK